MSEPYTSRIDHQFCLPPDIVSTLDKYYVLHWQGKHLISEISNTSQYGNYPEDLIEHQEVKYRVKFINGLSAWELINSPDAQYKISFRKLPDKSVGFALVKKASHKESL